MIGKKLVRDGFGEGLVELGRRNKNVVVLTADLSESTRANLFAKEFPERFIEVGVAEQNLATVASGLAAAGKIPFISSYAVFSPGRNWEQIRTTVCYNSQPVKIIGSHAGISVGPDGATHQGLEDIALMRVLPNMTVLSPSDAGEAYKMALAAADYPGPCYIRLPRSGEPEITTENTPFKIGKMEVFSEGKDVAIIATGLMVYKALLAARQLEESKISARVLNCHTIKPLDKQAVLRAAEEIGAIVTVEDHQIAGGMGSAVAEAAAQNFPVPVKIVGIDDSFGESGQPEELMEKYGLSVKGIIKAVTAVLRMKNK